MLLRYTLLIGSLALLLVVGFALKRRDTSANVGSFETQEKNLKTPYGTPTVLGRLNDLRIIESSGLVASRANPGSYWTHNDAGNDPLIYAFDSEGQELGAWRVQGAEAEDWEDIAIGPGSQPGKPYIYIGDTGDNEESRSQIVVYSFAEPAIDPATRGSGSTRPQLTEPATAYRFRYPDGKHDAEALMVHPTTGKLYIVTKVPIVKPSVYEASPPFDPSAVTVLKKVTDIHIPSVFGGVITGGDISPDGKRVALCDLFQGYELILPDGATSFDEIWKQRMVGFDLGKRKQGESIAYRLDGKAVLATSEGKRSDLIQVILK